jgi:hypothetical protein
MFSQPFSPSLLSRRQSPAQVSCTITTITTIITTNVVKRLAP